MSTLKPTRPRPRLTSRLVLAAALALASAGASAAPQTYVIDPNHTAVTASWSHFGFSHPVAHFGQADGAITYDPDNVGQSSVTVTLPLAGLESHVPAFNDHLRSAELFDAARFPAITFRSSKVESAGDGKLRVSGDITIKGVTRPAVLDVTVNKLGEHPMAKRPAAGFDAVATVKRSDFGVGLYAPNVSDEVSLRITTEAVVAKAGVAGPARPATTIKARTPAAAPATP